MGCVVGAHRCLCWCDCGVSHDVQFVAVGGCLWAVDRFIVMGGHGMLGGGRSGCWLWLQVVFGIFCHSFSGGSWSSLCVGTGHRLWLLFVSSCLWLLVFMASCCLSL